MHLLSIPLLLCFSLSFTISCSAVDRARGSSSILSRGTPIVCKVRNTNLTQLVHLALGGNKLIGEIPSFIANFTQLIVLDLGSTQLRGSIPAWISRLENLKSLNLGANNFSGNVELDMFHTLRGLQILDLSNLDLVLPNRTRKKDTLPQFASLLLQSCNLTRVPDFLANQKQLKYLDLANNQIQGSLVIPSPYLIFIDLSNNELSGEIPPLICNASSLNILDLMYNNLSGEIPSCLGNLGNLFVLNLHANSFEGTIPDTFTSTSKLKWITLSSNQVQGSIPRSLVKCSSLEVLDLSNNRINDTFPIWLGGLPSLRALILGSNKLHGMMPLEFGHAFSSLHVIDLSNNMLTGNLSSELFLYNRQAMEVKYPIGTSYLLTVVSDITSDMELQQTCIYLFTITNKGREAFDEKILNVFTSIDLSNNRFTGKIPTSIGNLVGLQALNLSHNDLIGSIPLSLGNLSSLESLDLSSNMLSGNIPQQLTSLTFLEIFNVSYNNLTGAIPKGKQFDTFENISFEGNIGLCGGPLSKKCGDLQLAPPASQGQPNSSYEEDDSSTMVDWLIISLGYLSGLVVGLVLGNFLTAKYGLFSVTLGRRAATKQQRNLIN